MLDSDPSGFMTSDIVLNINCHRDFIPQARYAFKTLFTIIGLPYIEIQDTNSPPESCKVLVNYGSRTTLKISSDYLIQIKAFPYSEIRENIEELKPQSMQARKEEGENSCFPPELIYFAGEPKRTSDTVIYSDSESKIPLVVSGTKELWCGVDFISFIYYLLSLESELHVKERDRFGRITRNSRSFWPALFEDPQIDLYIRFFKGLLLRSSEQAGLKLDLQDVWPDQHSFALCLSHDVDRLQSWTFSKIKRAAFSAYGKGNYIKLVMNLLRAIRSVFYKDNWSGNIKYIVDLEASYGCHSTFFFISNATSQRDPRYSLSSMKILSSFQTVNEAGSHIGLHGSFNSYLNSEMLETERTRLQSAIKQDIQGLRQHYLRFGGEESFRAWESAGFRYDSTLGFSDGPGYRCGISFPFYPFSHSRHKPHRFLEIPLIVMDTVLFLKQNLSLNAVQAWKLVQKFLNNTLQNSGCLTINWHNNNIHKKDVTGYSQLYEKILVWADNHNAWICSPDEMYAWWKEREKRIWKAP